MTFSGSLDTNAVLRLLINDIPPQHEAVKALLTKASKQLAVADTAIIELVFVLERYYGFSRQQTKEAVIGLMQLRGINCNRTLFEKALSIYLNHPALSFEDCCLSTYATLNEAEPLWTFDKKLATQTANAKLIRV
ncbi:MAG: PIN domain-containing protein [Patescibacteria group bacterium]